MILSFLIAAMGACGLLVEPKIGQTMQGEMARMVGSISTEGRMEPRRRGEASAFGKINASAMENDWTIGGPNSDAMSGAL